MAKICDYLKMCLLLFMPKTMLTRWIGKVAQMRLPKCFLDIFIRIFVRHYHIDMNESSTCNFKTFNDFFTRELHSQSRPIAPDEKSIISPVDGRIAAYGDIRDNVLLQAKGISYPIDKFLMYPPYTERFANGIYVTIYLSPRNYHRIHAPIDGMIKESYYIPGTLFPVNPFAVKNVQGLFTLNERLITIIECATGCHVAVVKIGATIVGKIQVTYDKIVPHRANFVHKKYAIHIEKGKELGKFLMGSTVILLFEHNRVRLAEQLCENQEIRLGEIIAQWT